MTLWLVALGITLAVEIPVVAAVFPGQRVRLAAACAPATLATHAFMHLALPRLTGPRTAVLAGEAIALVAEAAVYAVVSRPHDVGRALVAASLANALSYGAGLLVFR